MADFNQLSAAFQQGGGQNIQYVDQLGVLCQQKFKEFLTQFSDLSYTEASNSDEETEETQTESVYAVQVQMMKEQEHTTLYVDFNHVLIYDAELARGVQRNFHRFEPYLRKAVQNYVREIDADYVIGEQGEKEFFVGLYNLGLKNKIRDLRTEKIGQLVSITGTVTRSTEVRPELLYGTFRCDECGTDVEHVSQQHVYTTPRTCRNNVCNNRRSWTLDTDRSKFTDFQKLRVQENSNEIPPGSMPRTLDVVVRGQNVEIASAGEKCVFTGMLIVIPDVGSLSRGSSVSKHSRGRGRSSNTMGGVTGLKDLGVRELSYRLAFLACSVECPGRRLSARHGQETIDGHEDVQSSFTRAEKEEILRMRDTQMLYLKLARSCAPSVFGHDDVKRGLLLGMLGGVDKKTKTGLRLRGEINILLVGDPSTAKSQCLKFTNSILPRSVYTSGKASSAAGLTAAIAKDSDSGEFVIEAGALMLADNSICCIDEFDKMNDDDCTALHEAMEQGTISITKAGIVATLRARASIFAACNPIHGRYDRSKTLRQNVGLTPPIMSRFDVFFVILDQSDENFDERMAQHVINLHRGRDVQNKPEFTKEQLVRYIRYAKTISPKISPEAQEKLISCYTRLRQKTQVEKSHTITVRQLESMIRLSEALARLYLDDTVRVEYVGEAYRLMEQTLKDIHTDDVNLQRVERDLEQARQIRREREKELIAAKKQKDAATEEDEDADQEQGGSSKMEEEEEEEEESSDDENQEPLQITYASYTQMLQRLCLHIKHEEKRTSKSGMKQSELVNWYLEEHSDTIEDMDELTRLKRLVETVIHKLVTDDGILQIVGDYEEGNEDDRVVMVNPNHEIM